MSMQAQQYHHPPPNHQQHHRQQHPSSYGYHQQQNNHFYGGGGSGGHGRGGYGGQQQQQYQYDGGYQQQQYQDNAAAFLNANASEFVPKSNLSASAVEFVPPAMARNTSQWGGGGGGGGDAGGYGFPESDPMLANTGVHFEVHPMERLTDAVATLIYSPGKFDRIASEQTTTLNASINDVNTLHTVVGTIFDSAMTESNFRSSGARLFAHLSNSVAVDFDGETFKTATLKR